MDYYNIYKKIDSVKRYNNVNFLVTDEDDYSHILSIINYSIEKLPDKNFQLDYTYKKYLDSKLEEHIFVQFCFNDGIYSYLLLGYNQKNGITRWENDENISKSIVENHMRLFFEDF